MTIHDSRLEDYLEELAMPQDGLLRELTDYGREQGFPIVGPQVGRFLQQLATGMRARRVFELGSGFGYSTLWLAHGLSDDGIIHHTDGDPARSEKARELLTRAGFVDRVRFHVGDAVEILETLEDSEPFDILLCDIDKHAYAEAYEAMRPRIRVGGYIVIDNLIWDGKVCDPSVRDADTEGVREYIERMWNDPDFLSSLLPIRDGVGLHLRLR
jgi:predicted O-methyltransferase YrrM